MEKLIPCRFHVEVGSVLKAEGMRTTKQRLDIWDELCSTDDHRDIETILQSLIKKKINVSRATLYRTIDVFVKHDLLKKVSLGNGKILYEHNKNLSAQDMIIFYVRTAVKSSNFLIVILLF